MDPLFRPNLRSGNHLGSDDGKLISGDVPDQIRRVGAKSKPIANTIDADPDFSQSIEVGNPNPNPVDTGNQSPSAQDKDLNIANNQTRYQPSVVNQAALVDRMHGIHKSKEVLEDIQLIKSYGMQDALGQWVPRPDTGFQWPAYPVDVLFQLGEVIEKSQADFVVDGQPKHYAMLVPVNSEVNNRGLIPAVPTISSSSSAQPVVTDLTLTAETLALHDGHIPSKVKDNIRPLTPEKDRKEKQRGWKSQEVEHPFGIGLYGECDDVGRTPPKVSRYVNYWPHLLPELGEPDDRFNVPVGGIPPPMNRGNINRRMRSILGPDNPKIQQWKDVQYADIKVSHESRLLAFSIFEVMVELVANHLPVPDDSGVAP